jgi:hypothetical protein
VFGRLRLFRSFHFWPIDVAGNASVLVIRRIGQILSLFRQRLGFGGHSQTGQLVLHKFPIVCR